MIDNFSISIASENLTIKKERFHGSDLNHVTIIYTNTKAEEHIVKMIKFTLTEEGWGEFVEKINSL